MGKTVSRRLFKAAVKAAQATVDAEQAIRQLKDQRVLGRVVQGRVIWNPRKG